MADLPREAEQNAGLPRGAERNAGESPRWTYATLQDPDGTYRVEITDEDGEAFPVARQVTPGQAERLVQRIAREALDSHQPVKAVIRDPYFMAATIITLKRQPI